MCVRLFMLVFFCSAAAAADDTSLGLGAGIGYGYDGAGVRLELIRGHFGVSAGVGSANFFKEGYPLTRETGLRSAAFSVRFFSGDAEGLMLALSAMGTLSRSRGQFIPADATQNQYLHLAMLVGHRWNGRTSSPRRPPVRCSTMNTLGSTSTSQVLVPPRSGIGARSTRPVNSSLGRRRSSWAWATSSDPLCSTRSARSLASRAIVRSMSRPPAKRVRTKS